MKNESHPDTGTGCSRRTFVAASLSVATGGLLAGGRLLAAAEQPVKGAGPAARYTPRMKAAFVRRKEDYGIAWPGAIYDGAAAFKQYREKIGSAAKALGMEIDARAEPIYSEEEGAQWVAQAETERVDGLLLVMLDRQKHAWPTATRAVDSPVPTIIFSPIGTSFTTNTAPLARKEGAYIASTDDFNQAVYGMRMVRASAKLREARFLVIKGDESKEVRMAHFGTKMRYIPAQTFLDLYRHIPAGGETESIADEYVSHAERVAGPSGKDVENGVKSYLVARRLLEQEEADGITMDCLGALGATQVSLPCIAWSRMLDHGVPAACEADLGACIGHALVQYLFERPGFQQDPVADTSTQCLIGAHCTCPTRLNGFSEPPEPYFLSHHHGNRDAVPVPKWRAGQRVTVMDVVLAQETQGKPRMIISTGTVVDNVSVPPAGGCVVSVRVKLDGLDDLLAYPGFHQLFFYGDYKRELEAYCRLFRIQAQVV